MLYSKRVMLPNLMLLHVNFKHESRKYAKFTTAIRQKIKNLALEC